MLTQIVVAAPEDVFIFFVPQWMPYWYGPEMRSSFETQGCGGPEFRAGSKVRISGRLATRTFSHTAIVRAFEKRGSLNRDLMTTTACAAANAGKWNGWKIPRARGR